MNRTVILAAGGFPSKDGEPWRVLASASRVVACDSAADAFYGAFRRWPDVVVGDMDSVSSSPDAEVVRDAGQDDNDLAKAFALLRERYPEVSEIHILGAGGKNEAHTVGNLGWLMEWERRSLAETGLGLAARGINVDMVSDWTTAFAVSPNDTIEPVELYIGEGRRVSFFSTDPKLRISSQGLQWQLDNVDLTRWWGATLNRTTAPAIRLTFNEKSPLLVVLD